MRQDKPTGAGANECGGDGNAVLVNINDSERGIVRCRLCGEALSPDSKCGCCTRDIIYPLDGCEGAAVHHSPFEFNFN